MSKDILIESPNGDRIYASQKAFNVIYKPLYNYKIVEAELEAEVIQESNIEPEKPIEEKEKDNKNNNNKKGRRPKLNLEVGE